MAEGGHLSAMQLFYELKHKFPSAPDPVVSECIRQSGHDPAKCEALLRASCASRGFLPPLSGGKRGFCAPLAGVEESIGSRARSAGRNSMLSEQQTAPASRPNFLNTSSCSKQRQISYSETYEECSVNREPTPPPRPPLPASMVHDPFLNPFQHRFFDGEDDYHQDYEVSVNCSARGVHVTSTCSSPISANVPAGSPLRHTASLHVHPTPHFLSRPTSLTSVSSEPRSYTSVNLTLRSPSLEPQPPIDIRSASTLTYSTSAYNPIQGFQSQLHIEIGPGCGTVSAVRTGNSGSSPAPGTPSSPVKQHQVLVRTVADNDEPTKYSRQAGLARQMERKCRLEKELRREKERLAEMNTQVAALTEDLNKRQARKAIASLRGSTQSATRLRAEQLRAEIKSLQEECDRMTHEVDLHGAQVPLGETAEEFYQNIYTGQSGFVLPAPSNFSQSFQVPGGQSSRVLPLNIEEEQDDGPQWTCSVCTFRNHPLLGKCEQCEMPRISLGTDSRPPPASSSGCFCHPLPATPLTPTRRPLSSPLIRHQVPPTCPTLMRISPLPPMYSTPPTPPGASPVTPLPSNITSAPSPL